MKVVKTVNSDYTAVVRDDSGIHVLKCKILDEHNLLFQMLNKKNNTVTPLFKIKADFGLLKFAPSKNKFIAEIYKKFDEEKKLTKNVNRNSLIGYYQQIKFDFLIGAFHSA